MAASIVEYSEVGYFFNSYSDLVSRYDIAQERWLDDLKLENVFSGPTAGHVDADGIYVAFGKALYRYDTSGKNRTHLINVQDNVIGIHSDGNVLFVNYSSDLNAQLLSIDKSRNTVIDSFNSYPDAVYGSAIAPSVNRIFGRTAGLSPSDIHYVEYTDAGTFAGAGDSPYHGDYPTASRVWVYPDGSRVVDDSGVVYSTDGLVYLNKLGAIDDVDFLGAKIPIVLYGSTVTSYTAASLPSGSLTLARPATKIFVNETAVVAFSADPSAVHGYQTQIVPLTDLKAPTPVDPVNPVGLAFVPDKIMVMPDRSVLLFSKAHQSIFRWNPYSQSYQQTIPLVGTPKYCDYSAVNNTIYLAYASGLIRKIDLNLATPVEVPFAMLPGVPGGLATAGEFIFAEDDSGAWATHYVFSAAGDIRDSADWNYYSWEYVWNGANRQMYFFRDGISPNDLLSEEISESGQLAPCRDSPLHDSTGFVHPIRVSPEGDVVVLGSGVIHDARTLERSLFGLSNTITDAAWLGSGLYTLRSAAGVTQVQQWLGTTYELGKVAQRNRVAQSLVALDSERLLLVTLDSTGVPVFEILNGQLDPTAMNLTWHNAARPMDVNGDLAISPFDVLLVVNYLNSRGSGVISGEAPAAHFDVNNDGMITPLDCLITINYLNGLPASGEGELGAPAELNRDFLFAFWFDPEQDEDSPMEDWATRQDRRCRGPVEMLLPAVA